jgi:hypothetical protein
MKKIYGLVMATIMMFAMICGTASASLDMMSNQGDFYHKKSLQHRYQHLYTTEAGETNKPRIILRGKWGYADDNESDGYFGGVITRKGRFGVIKGLFNTSENENHSRFYGIMRKGYFNGRILGDNDSGCHITGLYKIDRENQLLKFRWMTPIYNGWGVAKLSLQN